MGATQPPWTLHIRWNYWCCLNMATCEWEIILYRGGWQLIPITHVQHITLTKNLKTIKSVIRFLIKKRQNCDYYQECLLLFCVFREREEGDKLEKGRRWKKYIYLYYILLNFFFSYHESFYLYFCQSLSWRNYQYDSFTCPMD